MHTQHCGCRGGEDTIGEQQDWAQTRDKNITIGKRHHVTEIEARIYGEKLCDKYTDGIQQKKVYTSITTTNTMLT